MRRHFKGCQLSYGKPKTCCIFRNVFFIRWIGCRYDLNVEVTNNSFEEMSTVLQAYQMINQKPMDARNVESLDILYQIHDQMGQKKNPGRAQPSHSSSITKITGATPAVSKGVLCSIAHVRGRYQETPCTYRIR